MNEAYAWELFEITGNIEAYLLYKEQCSKKEEKIVLSSEAV